MWVSLFYYKEELLMALTIKKQLIPSSRYAIKAPYSMDAQYVTVHNTANDASAQSEINYMVRNDSSTSYHYAVDDKEAIQAIPHNRNAWHAGDSGRGDGNRKSIGVEICYSKSGGDRFNRAVDNGAALVAHILKETGLGIDRVKTHKHWTQIGVQKGYSSYVKNCPHRILDSNGWDSFLKKVERELAALNGGGSVSAPETKVGGIKIEQPKPKSSSTQLGLVDWMNKNGMDSSYSNREKLAKQHGISGYKGTADQNEKLLDKLQSGAKKSSSTPAPSGKGDMKTNSIVEYLQSIGQDSSFNNRAKLAKQYGISGYDGSASQNTQLLDKMRGGSAPAAKSAPAPKPASSSSGIKSVGKIKIVNVNSAAIVMDKPDAKNSKNLGTIAKGKTIDIAGSVSGKNSDSGYWEVIYNGKRAYVTGKMGQMV